MLAPQVHRDPRIVAGAVFSYIEKLFEVSLQIVSSVGCEGSEPNRFPPSPFTVFTDRPSGEGAVHRHRRRGSAG